MANITKTMAFIYLVLINLIFSSMSFALPPSVERLNKFLESNDIWTNARGTYIDTDFNIHAFYLGYPENHVNSLSYLRIDTSGKDSYGPKLVCKDSTLLSDPAVIQDNRGYFHVTANMVGLDCAADYYFQTDQDGNLIEKFAPVPYGELNVRSIYDDSIFVAFRRDIIRGCGASFEEDYEIFWLFLLNRSKSRLDVINFPIIQPDYHTPFLQKLNDSEYLVITLTRPGPSNYLTYFRFHSFIAELNSNTLTNHISGDMMSENLIYSDLNSEIIIDGPHSIWRGDTLLIYMRIPPTRYYHDRIVKDSLVAMAFDKSGNRIDLEGLENSSIIYKKIDKMSGSERLMEYRTGTREGFKINWKYSFGLISFKDFPKIYIDLGEE